MRDIGVQGAGEQWRRRRSTFLMGIPHTVERLRYAEPRSPNHRIAELSKFPWPRCPPITTMANAQKAEEIHVLDAGSSLVKKTCIQHRLFWIIQFKQAFQIYQLNDEKKGMSFVNYCLNSPWYIHPQSIFFRKFQREFQNFIQIICLLHKESALDDYSAGTSTWFTYYSHSKHSSHLFHWYVFHLMLMLNENFLVWLVSLMTKFMSVSHTSLFCTLYHHLGWSVIIGDSRKVSIHVSQTTRIFEYDFPNRRNAMP